ncbi:DUF423 domain-containing protein [Puia dinghuensis]|uniref:DUF423 domain-containing protein n=1 Tax=Puia dinghuensis TaxID=1792502 RepID=A0A8J2UI46_9BACT|nr:DUF423 domain-containing protein [Puia dinghuensis]GGB21565.1 DUF423 domain-containing protein [Puia dinghuensis]
MNRNFLSVAALLGALSVALGAFAAHKLKTMVGPDTVAIFETGVRYQFYHVFALLFVAFLSEKIHNRWMIWAGNCFIMGIVFFCGSLYVLTALTIAENTHRTLAGIATPIGGVFFIAGWIFLYLGVARKDKS